jgi:hypothetical protein
MSETIIIDISPAGASKVEAEGFQGTGCAVATRELELVLGGGAVKRKEKPEYYQPPVSTGVNGKLTF